MELDYGDGRVYQPGSLPGTVGRGRTTLYHHEEEPFYKTMSQMTRDQRLDPAQPGASRPTPQGKTDYMTECPFLSPGCRVESLTCHRALFLSLSIPVTVCHQPVADIPLRVNRYELRRQGLTSSTNSNPCQEAEGLVLSYFHSLRW